MRQCIRLKYIPHDGICKYIYEIAYSTWACATAGAADPVDFYAALAPFCQKFLGWLVDAMMHVTCVKMFALLILM
jgi:hypothetical protein